MTPEQKRGRIAVATPELGAAGHGLAAQCVYIPPNYRRKRTDFQKYGIDNLASYMDAVCDNRAPLFVTPQNARTVVLMSEDGAFDATRLRVLLREAAFVFWMERGRSSELSIGLGSREIL
jgi:hypothetical protein